MSEFVHLLDVLGIKRTEDLLFKVRPSLKEKVQNVKTIKENCIRCGLPNVMAWTYEQDGQQKSYRFSEICSGCIKGVQASEITNEMLAQRKQTLHARWYHIKSDDQCGFRNYEPCNLIVSKALEEAKWFTKELIKGDLTLNCLMMGSTGTGKSHLAKAIAKTAYEKNLSTAFIEATELFEMIKSTFGHDRHKEILMNEFISFDVVVIDDVGLETKKQSEVSWTVSEWTSLINARSKKSTVFTTNLDDSSLGEIIGKRAFSRMYDNTKFIDLFTDDYRKKKRIG
ncbi:ATP-binding protein [Niallia sp. 01092]|uniref:ATP-binding protein n=1 Tax=unclassified Niallia TaxID=2837522 RepID=UPI003FD106D7